MSVFVVEMQQWISDLMWTWTWCTDLMLCSPTLSDVTVALTHFWCFLFWSPGGWRHILSGTTAIVLHRKWTPGGQFVLPAEGQFSLTASLLYNRKSHHEDSSKLMTLLYACDTVTVQCLETSTWSFHFSTAAATRDPTQGLYHTVRIKGLKTDSHKLHPTWKDLLALMVKILK